MNPKRRARKPAPMPQGAFLYEVIATLGEGKAVRKEFEGGRLHIDRPLPFLCVHIANGTDHMVARDVASANASYLIVDRVEDALAIIEAASAALQSRFGHFILLDVDELERDRLLTDDAPFLRPFEVTLSATADTGSQRAMASFAKAVEAFEAKFRTPQIDIDNANEDPCVRPELLALGLPLLTLRFAPVYRVPQSEAIYPALRERLVSNFLDAALQGFSAFIEEKGKEAFSTHRALGRKAFVDAVERADRSIDDVASGFDFLLAVTPINSNAAWQDFKANGFERAPRFLYRPLTLMVEREKRQLFSISLDRFEDPVLHEIYREKQQELDLQLTMIAQREGARFIEFGRALYGPVENSLLEAAREILAATQGSDRRSSGQEEMVDCFHVERRARAMISHYRRMHAGFEAEIELRDDIPAGLMVSGGKLLISRRTRMSSHRVDALLNHEVGVHLLTYYNGSAQGLRVFRTGLAGYEGMQEGLAVFAEYLAGGFTVERLRLIAARVVGCALMLDGAGFVEAFHVLVHDHDFQPEQAFALALRVYRGGGLAKDAIYLRGLLELLSHLKGGGALDPFWMGKISASHFRVMQELATRGLLKAPLLHPVCLDYELGRERLEKARSGLSALAMLEH
jgi:uncharacterized protein (TIGR02421 family)